MNFYGKYRALVTNISDPEGRGRIKVKCPKAYGDSSSPWCLPCLPYFFEIEAKSTANSSQGVSTSVKTKIEIEDGFPKVGNSVWIEFEEGKTSKPIWVGHWEWTGEVRK